MSHLTILSISVQCENIQYYKGVFASLNNQPNKNHIFKSDNIECIPYENLVFQLEI